MSKEPLSLKKQSLFPVDALCSKKRQRKEFTSRLVTLRLRCGWEVEAPKTKFKKILVWLCMWCLILPQQKPLPSDESPNHEVQIKEVVLYGIRQTSSHLCDGKMDGTKQKKETRSSSTMKTDNSKDEKQGYVYN